MKLGVALLLWICCLPCVSQTLLSEDFSSAHDTIPPDGWINFLIKGQPDSDKWQFNNPYQVTAFNGGFASFAGFYYSDDGIEESSALVSPPFSCQGEDSVTLRFHEYFYQHTPNGAAQIQISTDGGERWIDVESYNVTESPFLPTERKVNLSSYAAHQSSVRLRFVAFGNGTITWLIDEVVVQAGETTSPQIIHEVPALSCDSESVLFKAKVTDASGVSVVQLIYSLEQSKPDTINMQMSTSGYYQTQLELPPGKGIIQYHIEGFDNSPNKNKNSTSQSSKGKHKVFYGTEPSPFAIKDFEDAVIPFSILNPDSSYSWGITSDVGGFGNSKHALMMNFFDNDSIGQTDFLISQNIQLPTSSQVLSFDLAYALYKEREDQLLAKVSNNGGQSWEVVYTKKGAALATTSPTEERFLPTSEQWRRETVDLSSYSGQCILFSLEATSGFGNNLYIDNLLISEGIVNHMFTLKQNYPNPARQLTTVEIDAPRPGWVSLFIYDLTGRRVYDRELFLESHGINKVQVDVAGRQPGLYVYQLNYTTVQMNK